jgi:lysophospholipase L1-like esterase
VTRILAFGDSMTAGTTSPGLTFRLFDAGLPVSYPFRLQVSMTDRYTSQTLQVMNAGKPGEFSWQGRERLPDVIDEAKPDVLLLMEGANDLNNPGASVNETIRATVNELEEMVREANERHRVPVFIATLPPQRANSPKGGAAGFLTRFNDAVKTMAIKRNAQVVDVGALLPLSMIGQDGLHPTEAGYQQLSDIMLDALKARYEKAPEQGPAGYAPATAGRR